MPAVCRHACGKGFCSRPNLCACADGKLAPSCGGSRGELGGMTPRDRRRGLQASRCHWGPRLVLAQGGRTRAGPGGPTPAAVDVHRGAGHHFPVCPPFPSVGSGCSGSCMNGGSCRGEACLCQRGYTGTVCGQREYPPAHLGLGSQRAGLDCHLPATHRSLFWDQGLEGCTYPQQCGFLGEKGLF